MFHRILKFFGDDTIGQRQREAMLDVLVWAMFSDHHVAIAEGAHIRGFAKGLAWEGQLGVETFIDGAIKRARDVIDDEQAQNAYLLDIATRLATDKERQRAYDACAELMAVDGNTAPAEEEFLARVKATFAA